MSDMHDVLKVGVVLFMVIGVPMLSIFVLPPLAKAWGQRLSGNVDAGPDRATAEELATLRTRVDELEQFQERMAELEERLDFNERLLSQLRAPAGQLPPGPERH